MAEWKMPGVHAADVLDLCLEIENVLVKMVAYLITLDARVRELEEKEGKHNGKK